MNQDISRTLERVLRPHLRFLEPDAPLDRDEALGSLGLDSMAAVNVLMELESAFGVQVPYELLSAEMFETVTSLEAAFRPLIERTAR